MRWNCANVRFSYNTEIEMLPDKVEHINSFLKELADISGQPYNPLTYEDGVWPDVRVTAIDIPMATKLDEPVHLALLLPFILFTNLQEAFRQSSSLEKAYSLLMRYFKKWNIRILPILSTIQSARLDVTLIGFVVLPENLWGEDMNIWQKYVAEHFPNRMRTEGNEHGIYLDEIPALIAFCSIIANSILGTMEVAAAETLEEAKQLFKPRIISTVD